MLPLIDLREGDDAAASAIDRAMRSTGFFAVIGHGVPADLVDAAFAASHRFFALPDASKRRWHIDGWESRAGWSGGLLKRGFDPIGWQALDVGRPFDIKESFYLGRDSHGPNQWPDEADAPGFRAALDAYSEAMLGLAHRLLGHFALALDLPRGHFEPFARDPICTTRLLHYPPQPAVVQPGQIGCGAHTDWGALTLLAQDDAGGLQVQHLDGRWIDADPVPGSFVVNAGDLMQRWTNDAWRSTMHRVINKRSGRDRWSIAYFFDLDADVVIEPLEVPGCVNAERPARYGSITPKAHLEAMYRRTTVGA